MFLVTQAVLPGMRAARWGRIINLSSVAAQTGGVVGPHYAASKAGIHGLTHSYANLLAKEGITVNAVARPDRDGDDAGQPVRTPALIPVGRFGTVDEAADVVSCWPPTGMAPAIFIWIMQNWRLSMRSTLLGALLLAAWSVYGGEPVVVTPQDPGSVERAIVAAAGAGRHAVVIPPGVYHIARQNVPAGHEGTHLRLENLRDLDIEATGARLVFADCTQHAIIFAYCENVTFRGATLLREEVPFSQGRIESVSPAKNTVDVRIDRGYPRETGPGTRFPFIWMNVFDPQTGRWLTHLRSLAPLAIERLADDLLRVRTEPIASCGVPIRVGQRVAWRGFVCNDLCVTRCRGMRIVDVTIEKGCGMCFHETGGEGGNTFENCRVIRGPVPVGATEEPLLASNADGFHSADVRKGPALIRCDSRRSTTTRSPSTAPMRWCWRPRARRSSPSGCRRRAIRCGPAWRYATVLRSADGGFGTAKVVQARKLAGYQPTFRPDNNYAVFRNRAAAKYVELTLDRETPAAPAWLLVNQDELGSGYVIRDCHIRNTFARGVIAKASDGLIEGCTIESTARAAIEFNTETGIWSEADYAHDVLVRNNTFRHVSLNRKTGFLRHPGAVTIFAYKDHGYVVAPGGHRNIVLENNRFEDNDGVNVLVCSAEHVTLRGNQFLRPMAQPDEFGRDKGIDPGTLVWLNQSSVVRLENNVVAKPGPYLKKLVQATDTTTGSGLETGVREEK